ncbi:MAG: PPC domain-containing protein [Roseibacillus sp.]
MNNFTVRTLMGVLVSVLPTLPSLAFTPTIGIIQPRGGQRGTEMTIRLSGDRLYEPQEILLYQSGITVSNLEKEGDQNKVVKATITIAPDAPLGEHLMRLRCKGGVTYQRSFWVGQYPTVMEKRSEDGSRDLNSNFNEPQEIEINQTVQGVADREDADYYLLQCRKGQRLSVEVEGMRLGRTLFDPYVAILNKDRFELVASDDTALLFRDCAASIVVPEDGPYTVLVRESSYQGTGACQYRLHVGEFPRPTAVYPPGVRPGDSLEFTFVGDPTGNLVTKLEIPKESQSFRAFIKNGEWFAPSGLPVRISPLPYHNEVEPNEGSKEATPPEAPPIPVAFHGIISKKQDKDWFRFAANKGQKLRARVFARQLRSPLDPYIIVRKEGDSKQIGNNDDAGNGDPDSRLDFEIPEDGIYNINIRDQLYSSGPDYTYRIEIAVRGPSLSATLPYATRNDSQKWKMICVPRGNRVGRVVTLSRSNIGCDLDLGAANLPSGVSLDRDTASRSINTMPVIFEATPEAEIAGALYHLHVKDPKSELTGPFTESIHHIEVNNAGTFHSYHDERITIAVIEEAPFELNLEVPPVPLVKNGTMNLKITAKRHPDFKEAIKLTLPWRPPGVSAPSSVTIPKEKNEVVMEINANGGAAVAKWRIFVSGEATCSKGPLLISSKLQPIEIADPYVGGKIELVATEIGQNTDLVCTIAVHTEFEGEAKINVNGLPHGVTSEELTITKESKEITFPLAVSKEAKKGKTSNLFCSVVITEKGHPIRGTVMGGGVLRIDPPPPAPKKPVVAKKEPPKPAETKPVKKRLSRLEQLRLQSKNAN